jgi:hypothetical protein
MQRHYSILEIEAALRFWSEREPPQQQALGPHVRMLAEIYGALIFERAQTIGDERLSDAQCEAIEQARPRP